MRSGQIAVGVVLVSVAAALGAYVTSHVAESLGQRQADREWAEDHAGLLELAGRVDLPDAYAAIDCAPAWQDSRCWHVTASARGAADDVQRALASAGVEGTTLECHPVRDLPDASCTLRAPFGHAREVTVVVSLARSGLQPADLDDAATVAAAGTDVTLVIPALAEGRG